MIRASSRLVLIVAGFAAFVSGIPEARAQSASIAAVRAIHRGLTVQPRSQPPARGKPGQKLFVADHLQTLAQQKASVGFIDHTVLDMNQRTSIVLASAHIIRLAHGEISPMDVPGSHLQIQTGSASASAIGTRFDVWITPKKGPYCGVPPGFRKEQIVGPPGTTTVSVTAGLVRVASSYGSVLVHPGEWTHVRTGQPPTKPTRHNAGQDIAWTSGLP